LVMTEDDKSRSSHERGRSGHREGTAHHGDHEEVREPTMASAHDAHGAHVDHMEGHAERHAAPVAPGQHGVHKHRAAGHDERGAHTDHAGHEQVFRQRFWVCLALTIPVLLFSPMLQQWFGFTMPIFTGSRWIGPFFSAVIFFYGGVPFLRMASGELRRRQPGMMTLISLAISVAFVYSLAVAVFAPGRGFFWELVTLVDIMLLGHWIEMRSVRRASTALDALAQLMPDMAERIGPDRGIEQVPVAELRVGDLVLVRPGAGVPADGVVEDGRSLVNEAMITGESRPVEKVAGAQVIAGTVNGDGSLRVRVSATGGDTALAGIMRLVREAQESKSRTQVLADRAAAWLFYAAIAVAALTAGGWAIAVGPESVVVERAVTVLVIACPHALGLAVPLVVAITTSLAASNGVLVRDRLALESARDVDVVVFDKTGTLTEGQQGLVGLAVVDGWDEDRALALAAAVEGDSEHVIARAIREAAQERNLVLPAVSGFSALQGRGVKATSDGHSVSVGGPSLLEALAVQVPDDLSRFRREAGGKAQSVVYLVQDGQAVAAFALADVIRPQSELAVRKLHDLGIEVAMLTGDSEEVARAVAEELGIDAYFAEVLPELKDQKIGELQAQGKRVAMVGDGINDAPALARADIGIAIGSGTNVAIESAGIILVRSDPLDVVKVVELSRASYRKMVQNLIWATGYNVIALPVAAGVLAPIGILLSPALGALFMSLSTVIVAANAQFLRGTVLEA